MGENQNHGGHFTIPKKTSVINHDGSERVQDLQFVGLPGEKSNFYWNSTFLDMVLEKEKSPGNPLKIDYTGGVSIRLKGDHHPPIALMASDRVSPDLTLEADGERQSELVVLDRDGLEIKILKKVILYIEPPHPVEGFKAVAIQCYIDEEKPDEREMIPIFRIDSYVDGMAEEMTWAGIKHTPMKYESWRAKLRRAHRRSLERTEERPGLNS